MRVQNSLTYFTFTNVLFGAATLGTLTYLLKLAYDRYCSYPSDESNTDSIAAQPTRPMSPVNTTSLFVEQQNPLAMQAAENSLATQTQPAQDEKSKDANMVTRPSEEQLFGKPASQSFYAKNTKPASVGSSEFVVLSREQTESPTKP